MKVYSINMETPDNKLEYYPTRGPHMLRSATEYLMTNATAQEKEAMFDPCRVHPIQSALFQKPDGSTLTNCLFTKYMTQYLKEHPDHEAEFASLYSNDAIKSVETFLCAVPQSPLVFLQNASPEALVRIDRILGKRTNSQQGSVIYYRPELKLKQETRLPNVNSSTVYLGNKKVLYVCTKLKDTDQLMDLLQNLYSEQDRLVLVAGDFGHDISTEEYKYIEPIPILNGEFTTSREWSGFQPYPAFCNLGLKLKTGGSFILMNDIGEQVVKSCSIRSSTLLLDRTYFNGGTDRLPNKKHPLLNAMLDIRIHKSEQPVSAMISR